MLNIKFIIHVNIYINKPIQYMEYTYWFSCFSTMSEKERVSSIGNTTLFWNFYSSDTQPKNYPKLIFAGRESKICVLTWIIKQKKKKKSSRIKQNQKLKQNLHIYKDDVIKGQVSRIENDSPRCSGLRSWLQDFSKQVHTSFTPITLIFELIPS